MATATTTPVVPPATPATPVAPVTPVVAAPAIDDSFDAVFKQLSDQEDEAERRKLAGEPPVEPKSAATTTTTAVDPDALTDPNAPETPPVAAKAPAAVVHPVVPPVEPDLAAQLAAAQAEIKKLTSTPAAVVPPVVPPVEPEPPKEISWYVPSEDEKTLLADYEKGWPEISTAEALRTKQAVYNAVQFVFHEIAKAYGPALDRFAGLADAIETELTIGELRRTNQDYDTIRPEVVKWVDTLPSLLKNPFKKALTNGSPEEVTELIAEYRKANPAAAVATPAAATTPIAPVVPVAARTELTDAAKKAAVKLAVVNSGRTTQAPAADQNDFEAGWAEATANEKRG